jgi:hypothetical protein
MGLKDLENGWFNLVLGLIQTTNGIVSIINGEYSWAVLYLVLAACSWFFVGQALNKERI